MYLFFEVHNDGTGITDTALYEGLDTRNRCVMMMCTVTSTGVSLSPFDRVRTHLLDFFKTFEEKQDFHLNYWVPLELKQQNQNQFEKDLENYFEDRSGQKAITDGKAKNFLTMNPPFFDQFVNWMTQEFFKTCGDVSDQEKVKMLLKDILEYFNSISK